jgi:hypothetical protein
MDSNDTTALTFNDDSVVIKEWNQERENLLRNILSANGITVSDLSNQVGFIDKAVGEAVRINVYNMPQNKDVL